MVRQNTYKQLKLTGFQTSTEPVINPYQQSWNNRKKGDNAEKIAIKYLIDKGYKLLAHNYYCPHGEIDLIMFDPMQKYYVFVEVKSIYSEKTIAITQTISKTKARRIKNAAQNWISKKIQKWCLWRIDFIGIVLDNTSVVHIQSAIW